MLANQFIVIIEVMARVRASGMRDFVENPECGACVFGSRSSGCANCVLLCRRPPRYYQLRPGSLLPPRSEDLTVKPITLQERKPEISVLEKYYEIFIVSMLVDRRRVDEEKGEIHVALLRLCPLIVKL